MSHHFSLGHLDDCVIPNGEVCYDKCGKVMKASSLEGHMEIQHGVYCSSVVREEYPQPPDGGKRYR